EEVVAHVLSDLLEARGARGAASIDAHEVEAEARAPPRPRADRLGRHALDEAVAEDPREVVELALPIAPPAGEAIAEPRGRGAALEQREELGAAALGLGVVPLDEHVREVHPLALREAVRVGLEVTPQLALARLGRDGGRAQPVT